MYTVMTALSSTWASSIGLLMFAGVWILFGLGCRAARGRLFVWFTTLFVLTAAIALMPRGDG
jgi:hypothetical protein